MAFKLLLLGVCSFRVHSILIEVLQFKMTLMKFIKKGSTNPRANRIAAEKVIKVRVDSIKFVKFQLCLARVSGCVRPFGSLNCLQCHWSRQSRQSQENYINVYAIFEAMGYETSRQCAFLHSTFHTLCHSIWWQDQVQACGGNVYI